jgi:hypothetical protein
MDMKHKGLRQQAGLRGEQILKAAAPRAASIARCSARASCSSLERAVPTPWIFKYRDIQNLKLELASGR